MYLLYCRDKNCGKYIFEIHIIVFTLLPGFWLLLSGYNTERLFVDYSVSMFNLSGYNTERLVVDYSVSMFNLSGYNTERLIVDYSVSHRHSNSGPPFFLIWSLPRLWYGSLSGSISLNHLSIFYNISCYNSLVLLTFVSMSSCRITYIYIKV